MDYEKAYKELAGKAKSFLDKWEGVEAIDSELVMKELKDMFNEFTESKDEKIRKALIEYFQVDGCLCGNIPTKDVRAWLEKQGEQKHIEVVEPKFKVGDWIISDKAHEDYRICKIIEAENGKYKIESVYGYSGYNQYKVFDSIYRLWTVKDAKPGDILVDNHPFIFEKIDTSGHCYAYCGINPYDEFMIESESKFGEWTWSLVHPATKEQRDFLFAKMKEADYEWDAEKKELKKIKKNK